MAYIIVYFAPTDKLLVQLKPRILNVDSQITQMLTQNDCPPLFNTSLNIGYLWIRTNKILRNLSP